MKEILLTNSSLRAFVDDEDFDEVSKYKWYFDGKYVQRTDRAWAVYKKEEPAHRGILHTFILGPSSREKQIDHRNRNRLDNRRENLRFARPADNQRNRIGIGSSGFKGVSWDKRKKRWAVRIRTDNGRIRLGMHPDKETAAKVYAEAAKRYHGEFARTNG